jgi:hypothetical protein
MKLTKYGPGPFVGIGSAPATIETPAAPAGNGHPSHEHVSVESVTKAALACITREGESRLVNLQA